MPTALPPAVSMTANGSMEPAACRLRLRSISARIFSGGGMVVYHNRQSSPSRTASIRPASCACSSGSRRTRELAKVTGSGHGIDRSPCASRLRPAPVKKADQHFAVLAAELRQDLVHPKLVHLGHGSEPVGPLARQRDEGGAAIALVRTPHHQAVRHQTVDNAGDVAVRYHQEARQ